MEKAGQVQGLTEVILKSETHISKRNIITWRSFDCPPMLGLARRLGRVATFAAKAGRAQGLVRLFSSVFHNMLS